MRSLSTQQQTRFLGQLLTVSADRPVWVCVSLCHMTGPSLGNVVALFQAPLWAYLLCAIGLFVYQSLDAIDGKQARRTNSSSPLGELFDHGCDSLSTGGFMTASAFGNGSAFPQAETF